MPLFFFLLVLCSWNCSDNTPQTAINNDFSSNRIKIDTVVLEPIGFSSNLEHILDKCIKSQIETLPISNINVNAIQNHLNTNLKTNKFNHIKIVTGTLINLGEESEWAYIMEWHFDSTKSAAEVNEEMKKTKGKRLSVAPVEYKWAMYGQKIYYLEYSPYADLTITKCVYDYIIQINEK
jgi:hypothetical protein